MIWWVRARLVVEGSCLTRDRAVAVSEAGRRLRTGWRSWSASFRAEHLMRTPVERSRCRTAADQETDEPLLAGFQVKDVAFGQEKLCWLDSAADKRERQQSPV